MNLRQAGMYPATAQEGEGIGFLSMPTASSETDTREPKEAPQVSSPLCTCAAHALLR